MSFVSLREEFGDSMPIWDPDLLPYSISEDNSVLSSGRPSSNILQHSNSVTLANQVTPTCTINKQMSSCMQENSLPYSQSNHSVTNISIKNITNGIVNSDRKSSKSSYFEEPSPLATSRRLSTLSDDQPMHLSLKGNPSVKSKPFLCRYCEKEYSSESLLSEHNRTHTGKMPHTCSTCGRRFATRMTLTRHKRTHTGEKPYTCSTCDRRFATRLTLTRHNRTHTGEKPYLCSTCGRRFAQLSALTRHNRTHTGEKPYTCSTCGRRFPRRLTLTEHNRTHTGEKPYACSTCGRLFVHHSALIRHNRTHTGEKHYTWSTC